jgi:hypothetical protein
MGSILRTVHGVSKNARERAGRRGGGEEVSEESIPGLHKRLKIRALVGRKDNPIPTRFLARIDCLKISELFTLPVSLILLIRHQQSINHQ